MKNYSYPRVTTSVTANLRSSARPAAEDTTVLFVPVLGTKGPEREIVKIHSLEEFGSTFGFDYNRLGLTALNIANWLTSGGTIYAYRIVKMAADAYDKYTIASDVKYAEGKIESSDSTTTYSTIKSKYYGSALNGYKVKLSVENNSKLILRVVNPSDNVVEQKSFKVSSSGLRIKEDLSAQSEYLGEIDIVLAADTSGANNVPSIGLKTGEESTNISATYKVELKGGFDGYNDYITALADFWDGVNGELKRAIGNHIETPIDLIMDVGYPVAVKKLMIKAISSVEDGEVNALRPDIRGYFDLEVDHPDGTNYPDLDLDLNSASGLVKSINDELFGEDSGKPYEKTANIFFYDQSVLISEEAYFDKDMTVYPSYFLSSLVPANDLNNGIQFPLAGKRRAELSGIKKLSENPDPDKKELLFQARVNYIEKDSRGYYFMSQRTFDGSSEEAYTALSFINNSRTTCRMVHDLEKLGRDYLFEFNDAITLANMSAVLNKYITNWIANRTLSYGFVEVKKDEYSDERVNVTLNIKFTGTIEVISIDIILD